MKKKRKQLEDKQRSIPEAYFDVAVTAVGVVGGAFMAALLWRVANKAIDRLSETLR